MVYEALRGISEKHGVEQTSGNTHCTEVTISEVDRLMYGKRLRRVGKWWVHLEWKSSLQVIRLLSLLGSLLVVGTLFPTYT